MFEELWLIRNSLCLYHRNWSDNPISVDGNLFSAFLTAFQTFQDEVFPNQVLKHINFLNERLVFSLTPYYSLVIRDQLEKPLDRSVMQVSNISAELTKLIEMDPDLHSYFSDKSTKLVSLIELEDTISPIIDDVIFMISMAENQVNKFDVITVLQIMREVRDLILKFNDDRIFHNFARNEENTWFYNLLFSKEDIELSSVPIINYKNLQFVIKDFIKQVTDSLSLYGTSVQNDDYASLHNSIMLFLTVNTPVLKKFGILDDLLVGPFRYFKFQNKIESDSNKNQIQANSNGILVDKLEESN